MKKLLTATTALALVSGGAAAELTFSGEAELGVDFNSEAAGHVGKHRFVHDFGVSFTGSGTTDAGLTFGGSAGFDSKSGGGSNNLGTVYISGDFGKITIGDNDAADLLAGGIADVGLNGVGVDDVAEGLRGTTAKAVRYDNSFGQISVAISAGTAEGVMGMDAVAASEFWILNPDGTRSAADTGALSRYSSLTGTAFLTERNTAWGLGTVTATEVPVTHPGTGATEIDIAGYFRGDDGKIYDDTDTPVEVAPSSNAGLAFAHYERGFNLGADNMVGGDNTETGGQNADTPKRGVVYEDNAVAGVTAVPSDQEYAMGLAFEASGVKVGIGYDSLKTVSMGLGYSAGAMSTNALYVRTDDDTTGVGADLSYTAGSSTLTLSYARRTPDGGDSMDAMGFNLSHDLGGGAKVVAGFGQVDDEDGASANKASAGVSFAF